MNVLMKKHPKTYEVKKPNALLDATYSFNVYENRLWTLMLRDFDSAIENESFKVQYDLEEFSKTDISNWKSNARERAKETCETFMGKKITVNKSDDPNFHFVNIVERAQYKKDTEKVEVEFTKSFVSLMKMVKELYTKGDLELLMSFSSHYTYRIYWLIRGAQYRASTLIMDRDEFVRDLVVPSGYRNNDLKRRILEPAKKELMGSWAEFDFVIEKEKGKRGKFNIIFTFKNDIENEEYNRVLVTENWQSELLKRGVKPEYLPKFIKWVREEKKFPTSDKKKITFDGFYVSEHIRICVAKYETSQKDVAVATINSLPAFIYKTLEDGRFTDQVANAKRVWDNKISPGLPFEDTEVDLEDSTTKEIVQAWKVIATKENTTMEELATKAGYKWKNGKLYKPTWKEDKN